MAEYIDREAFLAAKREQYCKDCERRKGMKNGKVKMLYEIGDAPCRACGINDVLDDVEDFPAADVAPVRHGRWVDDKGNLVPWDEMNKNCPLDSAYCSVCGEWLTASDEYPAIGNYCPNCGARMDGDGE